MTAPGVVATLAAAVIVAAVAWVLAARAVRAARAAYRAERDQRAHESVVRATDMAADSRLAGNIAHDLSNLLTVITGHAELLIANLDAGDASIQYAHEIRRAALSAAQLTKPLRVLSGGQRAPADVVDVNGVTRRTATALTSMLGKNIHVTLALDEGISGIKIAAGHLEEILLNLCIHARDAMPGGGNLTVTTLMHTESPDAENNAPKEYVRIVIGDSSGGLSAAAQSALFEPFFARIDAGGNAVGLAKVDAIVKQAGGRIQVASAAGRGTTFTIDLSATSEPAVAPDQAVSDTPLVIPVLVVEDEPGVREFIRLVLVRSGHEVEAVASPHAALAALRRQPATPLMLVDVVMPVMDGYELVAEARKISPRVRVVFMSAFARDPLRHPNGDGFIAKPFTIESLSSIVEQTLRAGPRIASERLLSVPAHP